jgi:hypothetical protein
LEDRSFRLHEPNSSVDSIIIKGIAIFLYILIFILFQFHPYLQFMA